MSNVLCDALPKLWIAYASNENDVWYMIYKSKRSTWDWKTIHDVADLRNMHIDQHEQRLKNLMQWYVSSKSIPTQADRITIECGHPVIEDGKYWFNYVSYKEYTLQQVKKWKSKKKHDPLDLDPDAYARMAERMGAKRIDF